METIDIDAALAAREKLRDELRQVEKLIENDEIKRNVDAGRWFYCDICNTMCKGLPFDNFAPSLKLCYECGYDKIIRQRTAKFIGATIIAIDGDASHIYLQKGGKIFHVEPGSFSHTTDMAIEDITPPTNWT